MDEDGFWRLIDDVWAGERNVTPLVVTRLADRLSRLGGDQLDGFLREFGNAHRGAYRWDLWAAGYLIQDSMSDDGFTDFRTWLIAHGRTAYDRALAAPDTLADLTWRDDLEDMGLAELYGAQVMQAWGGRPSGLADVEAYAWQFPPIDPAGEPFPEDDPEWFRRTLPRLWAKVNGDPGGSPAFGVLRIR